MSLLLLILSPLLITTNAFPPLPKPNLTTLLSSLNQTLSGRLQPSLPLFSPCFPSQTNPVCLSLKSTQSPLFHSNHYPGFQFLQGEACLSDPSDQCLVSSSKCNQGVVSPYYISIQSASDLQAIFESARSSPGLLTLSIKNSGHDYVMRSSRRHSLAIWTRFLQEKIFHPEFIICGKSPTEAITFGAGVNTDEAVSFAHSYGYVFDGGSSSTIGVSGGWVLNGGHSVLSGSIGLAVDRVLEFVIVTGDGETRRVNECMDRDLFWALKGGGGGVFGVVLSSTFVVERERPLTAGIVQIGNGDGERRFLELLTDNMVAWALKGWGGALGVNYAIMVNSDEAVGVEEGKKDLKGIIDLAEGNEGGYWNVRKYENFYEFYKGVINTSTDAQPVGMGVGLLTTSRIIPVGAFESQERRKKMVDTVMDMQGMGMSIGLLATMPFLYGRNMTEEELRKKRAIHPGWYNSVWQIVGYSSLMGSSSFEERKGVVEMLKVGTDMLRELAPEGCTYSNEGLAWLDDWKREFWGEKNYERLLRIKKKYDPDGLLGCWHCVGWDESQKDYECISGLTP
ncbi:hypothetical protein QBC38DRAFT_515614 [Podospora fimiseda]|uniref:FAD-binding PCMH-type domain-containing protein n=1 Tax=Podospora fimiseda TaxID=252190 RepID=A0AAN7BIY4_9PEZI|nr:hypothetical protein QBC38DRAFT_515614 [Podospora fimiseda]